MMIQFKFLDYVIERLCLRRNDIRFVMNYLCDLLWYDDVNLIISHMRVALKGVLIHFYWANDYEYTWSYSPMT